MAIAGALAAAVALAPAASEAAFPGRNGRIAYIDPYDNGIFSVRPGGSVRRIVKASYPESPAFSPDGRLLAFTTYPAVSLSSRFTLELVRADGTRRRVLTRRDDLAPDWSSDGRRLVFDRDDPCVHWVNDPELGDCPPRLERSENWGTMIYFRRSGTTRLLTRGGGWPAWSPRGDWIALSSAGLDLIRPDGSNPHTIYPNTAPGGGKAWAPDGRRIAFTYYADRPPDPSIPSDDPPIGIGSVRPDGTGFRKLTRDGDGLAYSPDGRHIVFTRPHAICDRIESYGAGPAGLLWIMRANGSDQLPLHTKKGKVICARDPDWQPVP
jgi:Tol biopolymer transport system component